MFFVIAKYYIFFSEKEFYSMDMLQKLDSDIELGLMKQVSASLVEDNTLDALNWTSEFAG